jgi:hypothetical protein
MIKFCMMRLLEDYFVLELVLLSVDDAATRKQPAPLSLSSLVSCI